LALPLEFRIRGRRAFDEFRTSAKILHGGSLAVKVVGGKDGRAFAIAVPKRIGNAVRRNRLRRVLIEWIRLNMAMFPDGRHYLLVVRDSTADEGALLAELRRLAERIPRDE